jgi:hypothetical protein
MKIYCWEPESYGSWCYVLAKSPEAAKKALRKHLLTLDPTAWGSEYTKENIEQWLLKEPTSVEEGKLMLGEVA